MKASNCKILPAFICGLFILQICVSHYLEENVVAMQTDSQILSPILPASVVSVLAGEFQGLHADWLYIDIAATLGGREPDLLDTKEWDAIEKMFETAVYLDPGFEPTFRSIQAYLPWEAERPQIANQLLEKVADFRFWHWLPKFFIGFNHYFFMNDGKEASKYFLDASELKDAPIALATLGARLTAESGDPRVGIEFLTRMLSTTESETEKRTIEDRIAALKGVEILRTALQQYLKEQGKYPPNLYDLMFLGYIKDMPENPYHKEYYYKNGKVRFDSFKDNN